MKKTEAAKGAERYAYVIDRVDNVGRKEVKCLVEIVHLNKDAGGYGDTKDVGAGMAELVVARERQLNGHAESFDGHDRERSDQRADGNVYERRLGAVGGRDAEDKDG